MHHTFPSYLLIQIRNSTSLYFICFELMHTYNFIFLLHHSPSTPPFLSTFPPILFLLLLFLFLFPSHPLPSLSLYSLSVYCPSVVLHPLCTFVSYPFHLLSLLFPPRPSATLPFHVITFLVSFFFVSSFLLYPSPKWSLQILFLYPSPSFSSLPSIVFCHFLLHFLLIFIRHCTLPCSSPSHYILPCQP